MQSMLHIINYCRNLVKALSANNLYTLYILIFNVFEFAFCRIIQMKNANMSMHKEFID